ncbi:hypothetical protein GOBAR_AA27206 [Gossypium barbadense]|uniref:Cytochrome b5 heme-binding domain-containing protein n=1 Tax=Gossypium barbadense TaxID=3634 RepID=A0A2P5WQX1_GOSBA|nr:hypothetical protein GOBAR_AA27206 [Gossypium barbadense]
MVFTLAQVSEHNTPKDCWLIINDKVYDVTKYLKDHPGGDEVLLSATGTNLIAHETCWSNTMSERSTSQPSLRRRHINLRTVINTSSPSSSSSSFSS